MAEQGGGKLAHEIDIAMTVEVRKLGAIARDHREWERVEMQHRACVATGQVTSCLFVGRMTFRIGCNVA